MKVQLNTEVFNNDHIEVVDSVDEVKYIDVITSDNKKERVINIKDLNKKNTKKEITKKEAKQDNEKKIENLLLIGIDSRRTDFRNARADTIIIASINKLDKEVKLTSIMRDTYVKIPRHRSNRINAAYAFGGAKLLKETIKKNFNLDIEKHVVIDFRGFQKVIDIMGGIDVNVKKYEVNELNRCILGLRGGRRSNLIKQSGLRHLNGEQALGYCRIRKVGKGDYERTERQRMVLKQIIGKTKDLSIAEYPKVIANIYPYVRMNISNKECLKLIYDYYNVNNWNVESIQIPTNKSGKSKIINSMWVIYPDIDECVKCIKEFIY